ncbi:putative leucine-rich repeat-containing protein DDB_G0290503 [Liolophura sinensis]|uniref:putative leucine-rich repeat-containing protein DDB_G0290503 n=1 Tax=Liolophura sinensis TaxID=3198878 RepID=UPI00315937FB
MKEVESLLLIEKKGFELIEELKNENKKLNKENMRAVKDLTNTVEDLSSHNQKWHSQLEYLQRDNDRLKGERDKEKKTVRKLVAEKNELENTLKELKQVHPLTPEESNKIRISSVPGSQIGILHQIHEYEKQIKAKNTEIKRLQEELEDESVKAQNLLHEREKYNLELTDQRYEFKSVTDKTSKSQLFVDNLQQLLKDAGIPEFGGDLDKCVGHLLAVYQTCRREVERMQKENDKLAQQTDQGREHESSLMSQTTMSSELRDLRQIFQDSQRAVNANRAEFSKLQQNYEEKISSVINEKNELQQIVESQSHLGSQLEMVDRENNQLKGSIMHLQMELKVKDEHLARTISDLQRQIEHGERNIDELKSKHAKIQLELEDKNNKLRQCVSDLQSQYQRLELEYNNFRQTSSLQIQERDDKLKQSSIRISKLVAENVGRNNPFLEDLGSQNRSMKIAERFRGDLYGDIWCDTLDLLMDDGMPEEEALKAICDTLLAVYQFCRDHLARVVQCASSFLMNLTDTGLDPSLTGTQELGGDLVHLMSAMKDFLRASAMTVTLDKLLQLYTRRDGTDILPLPEALVGFTRQALAICWCMVTQDPPMSLLHTLDPGGGYDPSSFQAYRSSGIRAKFLVWPALLLTDSGPLMEKGVVFT